MQQPEYIGDDLVKISTEHFFVLYSIYQAYTGHEKKLEYMRLYYQIRKTQKAPFTVDRGKINVAFK